MKYVVDLEDFQRERLEVILQKNAFQLQLIPIQAKDLESIEDNKKDTLKDVMDIYKCYVEEEEQFKKFAAKNYGYENAMLYELFRDYGIHRVLHAFYHWKREQTEIHEGNYVVFPEGPKTTLAVVLEEYDDSFLLMTEHLDILSKTKDSDLVKRADMKPVDFRNSLFTFNTCAGE